MLIYKNDKDKDVKLTLPPAAEGDMPTEVVVKSGEEYEITDEQAKFFLNYDLQAKKTGDGEGADDTEDAEGAEKTAEDETESETTTVKNDRDFDVTVTYTENDEEKTATVKAGDEIKVPADQADAVKQQIADAEAEGDEETNEPETDKADDNADDDDEDEDETDEKESDEKSEIAKEKAALAEEKHKILMEKAEMKFDKLCESGKAVPAQKDAYMALAAHEGEVALAEGKTESVSTLLENLFESAPAHRLMEEEGESGDGESETELSDEEKEVAERFGNTEEEIKANKEK